MVEPILIKKDPHRNEHLPYKNYDPEVFQRVIDFVDLEDLTEFILSLNTERWVPNCYWKNKGKIYKMKYGMVNSAGQFLHI